MRRILLFQFSESGWRIAAAELELLEKHLEQGDEVMAVTCNGCRFGCDLNLTKGKLLCLNCRNQTRRGFGAMSQKIERNDYTEYLTSFDDEKIMEVGEACCLPQKELRDVHYQNFDLGEAVVSILISRFRNPDVVPEKVSVIARNLLQAGLAAYLSGNHVIEKYKPDLVYLFNGRGSQQRALLRACENQGVDYCVIEEGCDLDHYALFKNATPHDIGYRTEQMLKAWHSGDKEELKLKGADFFEKRAAGYKGYGIMKNFTASQEKGKLPDSWNSNLHNVVIYCSSEDEFAAIGDQWQNKLYGSQLEGLRQLSESSKSVKKGVKFYLRMHPNLSDLMNGFRSECESLQHEQFEVILPESAISSYDLMFACDTVVSFASTIGIEAVYWGKPSVLLGSCFYQNLDVAYQPASHEETMRLLTMKLEPKEKEGALIYASYLVTFGEPYLMSRVGDSPTDVTFRGVHLRGGIVMLPLLRLREKLTGRTIDRLIGSQDDSKVKLK